MDTNDVTVVTVNWLTARRTLGAIDSLRRFYPDAPAIIVDDGSDPKDEPKFLQVYRGRHRNLGREYDPDTEKLKVLDGVEYIQGPDLGIHPRSHGHCVDLAVEAITTRWMFHFHSDFRLTREGVIEALMDGLDETYCGAGSEKARYRKYPVLNNVAAIYNIEAGREHNVSFCPIILYEDGTTDPYPGAKDRMKPGGKMLEAGSYYTYRLHESGYRIKWVPNVHNRYGVHLRWVNGKWSGPY